MPFGPGSGNRCRWVSALRFASASTARTAWSIQRRSSVDVFGTTRLLEALRHALRPLLDVCRQTLTHATQQEHADDRGQRERDQHGPQHAERCPLQPAEAHEPDQPERDQEQPEPREGVRDERFHPSRVARPFTSTHGGLATHGTHANLRTLWVEGSRMGDRRHRRSAPSSVTPSGRLGQLTRVPALRRFWQASTTRLAIDSSAALPYERGSYAFLLPTSPSTFSTPS